MLRTDVPSRPGRRGRGSIAPLVSLRSPIPLLVAGIGVALLVIAVVTLPGRPQPEPTQTPNISPEEALTLVADAMRSGEVGLQIRSQGQARFDDGTWTISLGEAQFHFSQRNRIVVADNPAAWQLQYRDPPTR
jgi:hypothetical protein